MSDLLLIAAAESDSPPLLKRRLPMSELNEFTQHLADALIINATPSAQTRRTKALEFAMGMLDADTVEFGLESASKILVFLEEGCSDFDLRVRALSAASTVAMRSEGDSQANLVAYARVFLAFLNGATSSANPVPCVSAEPRSGVE